MVILIVGITIFVCVVRILIKDLEMSINLANFARPNWEKEIII